MRSSFDDEDSFKEAVESIRFNNPPSDMDLLALQRVGSSSSLPLQERNEDICCSNPQSDPNTTTIQQLGVGSSSGTPSKERFEVTQRYWCSSKLWYNSYDT